MFSSVSRYNKKSMRRHQFKTCCEPMYIRSNELRASTLCACLFLSLRWRQITGLLIVCSTVQAQIKENIKVPRHWPLSGEAIDYRRIFFTKTSNAENISSWWRHQVDDYAFPMVTTRFHREHADRNIKTMQIYNHVFQERSALKVVSYAGSKWPHSVSRLPPKVITSVLLF